VIFGKTTFIHCLHLAYSSSSLIAHALQDTTSTSNSLEEEVEHLSVFSAEQLASFDGEECRKNIANMENQKNK